MVHHKGTKSHENDLLTKLQILTTWTCFELSVFLKAQTAKMPVSLSPSLGNQLVLRLSFSSSFLWQQLKLAGGVLSAWASVSQPRFEKVQISSRTWLSNSVIHEEMFLFQQFASSQTSTVESNDSWCKGVGFWQDVMGTGQKKVLNSYL